MTTDRDVLSAYLDRVADLAHLALITPPEDRAHIECTIQFVCQALQAIAWARQQTGNAEYQREAAEVAALCRRIVEQTRAAGLRITDNDNSQ
jgi:hypothetical protein